MALRKKKSLVDQAAERAGDLAELVRPRVESAVESAVDFAHHTALPALQDAGSKAADAAAPKLADARSKAAELGSQGADLAASKAGAARDAAAKQAAVAREMAVSEAGRARTVGQARLADTRIGELAGVKPPKKKGKLKRVALLAVLAGAVVMVARKLQGGGATADSWQSTYTPPPAPAQPRHDSAGSTPGEALADAQEEPTAATTPDEPAEVVELKDPPQA